jgi:hypothetical protein
MKMAGQANPMDSDQVNVARPAFQFGKNFYTLAISQQKRFVNPNNLARSLLFGNQFDPYKN